MTSISDNIGAYLSNAFPTVTTGKEMLDLITTGGGTGGGATAFSASIGGSDPVGLYPGVFACMASDGGPGDEEVLFSAAINGAAWIITNNEFLQSTWIDSSILLNLSATDTGSKALYTDLNAILKTMAYYDPTDFGAIFEGNPSLVTCDLDVSTLIPTTGQVGGSYLPILYQALGVSPAGLWVLRYSDNSLVQFQATDGDYLRLRLTGLVTTYKINA